MQHIPVTSSQIASVAYDPSAAVMQVLFRRGGLYEYAGVQLEEFEAVLNPGSEHRSSVGVAFANLIKGQKSGRKLEGTTWPPAAEQAPEQSTVEASPEPAALPAEVQTVSRKSNELTTQATEIKVVDPSSQERASEILLAIASMRKEISDTFKPMKDAAFKAHRVICEQEKTLDSPLAAAEASIKGQIGSYVKEQNRLAREAESRLREEARLKAEEEARERSTNQAIEQAIALDACGDREAAEAVLASPAPVPVQYVAPAPVAANVAQVKGVGIRMQWNFRITDISAIPREYLSVNESAIRSVVKATSGRVRIPGIEPFEEPVVAASRRG